MPTTLRPITKRMNATLNTRTGLTIRRECWSAVTEDGLWEFERTEDTGTPWLIRYVPTGEVLYGLYGTLKNARQAVEHGWAKTHDQWRAEHAKGNHPAYSWGGCPDCQAHWFALSEPRRPSPL